MKKLILCCDGTWNSVDQEKNGRPCLTNVIKLAFRIAKHDESGVPQIVYYHPGVGTGNLVDRVTGGAFGEGLEENVYDAYRFLIANYEPGDQIFLFGFSRGAYTARSLGGMIRKCGIVKRECVDEYTKAVALYRTGDDPNMAVCVDFRSSYSVSGPTNIPIKCIGVWDTVGALGIPLRGLRWLTKRDYQFHDTELSGIVEFAFQALAIDEHREPFKPSVWDYVPKDNQIVEQVWFSGVHCDIGGGYVECGLSDISLGWMLENARRAGLAVDRAVTDAFPLRPDPMAKLHKSDTDLIYRLSPGINRRIGLATHEGALTSDPRQFIAPSTLRRWDEDPGYRPVGLREYFLRTNNERGKRA